MIDFTSATITAMAIHEVGNKLRDEEINFSKEPYQLDDPALETVLMQYLLGSFKGDEMFRFSHATTLSQNEVYSFCKTIFGDEESFFEQSKAIARHLYEQSTHPKVKAGELYVLLMKDCKIDGGFTGAVGIFKSENKDTFLKVKPSDGNYNIDYEDGINIHKLDKGCIVFNKEEEEGFKVALVDSSGSAEAQYWKNDFLNLMPCQDEYQHTKNYMNLCKSFVSDKLGEDFNLERADQIKILNDTVDYFKKNDHFSEESFANDVIGDPGMIGAFSDYKKSYQAEKEIQIEDDFEISGSAVKKQARNFKSILKLDKNFHIYIHGNREWIQKGYDEASGLHYYTVYFKEES